MGHDTHFLERIERLNYGQADRVLALYRDPEAVRFLLGKLDLPGGAERVALALSGKQAPPHVVLGRDGGFVTCLGSGMGLGGLPAVSFDRVERVLGQFEALREVLDGQVSAGAAMGKLKDLFHRAEGVSREQFEGLRPLRALLGFELLKLAQDFYKDCDDFRRSHRPGELRNAQREAHLLSMYWRSLWASNHLNLLLLEDVPDVERMVEDILRSVPLPGVDLETSRERFYFQFSWGFVRSGVVGLMLRGFYIAGRLGRLALAALRPQVERVGTLFTAAHNGGCLAAVGLRHARLREEVGRLLARMVRSTHRNVEEAAHHEHADFLQAHHRRVAAVTEILQVTFEHADAATEVHDMLGRMVLWDVFNELPHRNHPAAAYSRWEDLPEDIGLAHMAILSHDFNSDVPNASQVMSGFLPRAARADVADLYLPETWLRPITDPNNRVNVEQVRKHLASLNLGPKPKKPVQVERKPGRNEPCSCGSGKKYKACCGG